MAKEIEVTQKVIDELRARVVARWPRDNKSVQYLVLDELYHYIKRAGGEPGYTLTPATYKHDIS